MNRDKILSIYKSLVKEGLKTRRYGYYTIEEQESVINILLKLGYTKEYLKRLQLSFSNNYMVFKITHNTIETLPVSKPDPNLDVHYLEYLSFIKQICYPDE